MYNESPIVVGLKVLAKVKVCVHANGADADGRDMTLAPQTYLSRLTKNCTENIKTIITSFGQNTAEFYDNLIL